MEWTNEWMNGPNPIWRQKAKIHITHQTIITHLSYRCMCARGKKSDRSIRQYANFYEMRNFLLLLLFFITSHHYDVESVCIIITHNTQSIPLCVPYSQFHHSTISSFGCANDSYFVSFVFFKDRLEFFSKKKKRENDEYISNISIGMRIPECYIF